MSSEYRILGCIAKPVDGLDPNTISFVLGRDKACYWMVGKDCSVYWVLVERLDRVYHQPDIPRYSDEDATAFAENRLEDVVISDTAQIKVKHLWEKTTYAKLLAVEEGFMEKWTSGRIICIGDSVHKVCLSN
jgi:hypothetical protein